MVVGTFLVASLYSSVGHGGASGYLALMSLLSFPHEKMAVGALILNLLVSGIAFRIFLKASQVNWSLVLPFALTSIPAAFLGGTTVVSGAVYSRMLACVLLWAAFYLFRPPASSAQDESALAKPPVKISLLLGAGIGWISGEIGVGGGIFLSPLLLFFAWATPKQSAASSAFFIFANSFAGLVARVLVREPSVLLTPALWGMLGAALMGALFGSRLGAFRFSNQWLRRILAFVLVMASGKLLALS